MIVAGEAIGEDNPLVTRAALRKLLAEHPAIGALYDVSGGNVGVAEASPKVGRTKGIRRRPRRISHAPHPVCRSAAIFS